ncbi:MULTISPECIES: hypothetical protein [Burkholderia]|uniref:hypothetical protein n=1 Tax=Burkholderia TaxID=32008 RepID=UPI000B14FDE9|nr:MULTISPECIES: hypothetical protein [Burkholderia]
MAANWRDIVAKCVKDAVAARNSAVTGSRLRTLVELEAKSQGLAFPPEDSPNIRFSAFLEQFPDVVAVRRRPGQDFLTAPADNPQLLTVDTRQTGGRLRGDLFSALTRIDGQGTVPFYSLSTGQIARLDVATQQPAADQIRFAESSIEQEVADRKVFAEQQQDPQVRDDLQGTLSQRAPLAAFSVQLKRYALSRDWHEFRLRTLIDRLQKWSSENGVPWGADWIEEIPTSPAPLVPAPVVNAAPAEAAPLKALLRSLADVLTEDDLRRISLPLDVLVRAWGKGQA